MQGDVAEAQQLFQQALTVTEDAQPQAELNTASEDEWETSMPKDAHSWAVKLHDIAVSKGVLCRLAA